MNLVIKHLPFAAAVVAFLCIAFGAQDAATIVTAFAVTALGVKVVAQFRERQWRKRIAESESNRVAPPRADCLVIKPFSVFVDGCKLGTATSARVDFLATGRASIEVHAYVMRQQSTGESKIMQLLHHAFIRKQTVMLVCGAVGDEFFSFRDAKCEHLTYETEHVKGTTIVKASFSAPIDFIPESAYGIDKLAAEMIAQAHAQAVEQIADAN